MGKYLLGDERCEGYHLFIIIHTRSMSGSGPERCNRMRNLNFDLTGEPLDNDGMLMIVNSKEHLMMCQDISAFNSTRDRERLLLPEVVGLSWKIKTRVPPLSNLFVSQRCLLLSQVVNDSRGLTLFFTS